MIAVNSTSNLTINTVLLRKSELNWYLIWPPCKHRGHYDLYNELLLLNVQGFQDTQNTLDSRICSILIKLKLIATGKKQRQEKNTSKLQLLK